jgi:predicted tellurium resistance membrane protein TerC
MLFPFVDYWWVYAGFTAFVLLLLALDLGVFHRRAHVVSMREAALWTVIWVSLSLLFNWGLYEYARSAFAADRALMATSNVFAILGLRSMYFLLAGAVDKFALLRFGLAFVLIFVGLKMVWLNDHFDDKFPITWSLAIITALVGGSIVASLVADRHHRRGRAGEGVPAKA